MTSELSEADGHMTERWSHDWNNVDPETLPRLE